MADQIVMHAPIEFEMKVMVTDGKRNAAVTCSLPSGKIPRAEAVNKLIEQSIKEVQQTMPEFRLMTKREFWDHICEERAGGGARFAMPGSPDWDKPA